MCSGREFQILVEATGKARPQSNCWYNQPIGSGEKLKLFCYLLSLLLF